MEYNCVERWREDMFFEGQAAAARCPVCGNGTHVHFPFRFDLLEIFVRARCDGWPNCRWSESLYSRSPMLEGPPKPREVDGIPQDPSCRCRLMEVRNVRSLEHPQGVR
jgi:hypothetical protein